MLQIELFLMLSPFLYHLSMIGTIILFLLQIRWENRLHGDTGEECKVTVDGTDCPTTKQGKKLKAFWSVKF
jgi:hypothetical protein